MARLPQPGGDDGNWGEILNEYLSVSHASNGSLKPETVSSEHIKDNTIPVSKLQGTGVANGLALLDNTGVIPEGQIPGYLQMPALTTKYASTASEHRMPFLANIAKAKTGKFRIMVGGSTKAYDRSGPFFLFLEHLKAEYGDAGSVYTSSDSLGTTNSPYQGWAKQHYSGVNFARRVGSASSSNLTLSFYGDQLELWFSRETDSVATAILIDGVAVGMTPEAGSQNLSIRQVFSGLTRTIHTVVIERPSGSGNVYFNAMLESDSKRTGVEVINATRENSTSQQLFTPMANSPVTPIATNANAGLAAWVQTEVDAYIFSWHTRDLMELSAEQYIDNISALTSTVTIAYKPVLLTAEVAGMMALPNNTPRYTAYAKTYDHLLYTAATNNFVTLADLHKATISADLTTYANRFFPGVSNINLAENSWTGNFIDEGGEYATQVRLTALCQAIGVQPAPHSSFNAYKLDRVTGSTPATLPLRDSSLNVQGAPVQLPESGRAWDPISNTTIPYYRTGVANHFERFQETIRSSTTVDSQGVPYRAGAGDIALPSSVDWASGKRMRLTMRVANSPTSHFIQIRTGNGARMYTNGVLVPLSEDQRTIARLFNIPDSTIVTITLEISASSASSWININDGLVYELSLTDTDKPVLTYNAPVLSPLPASIVSPGQWARPSLSASAVSTDSLSPSGANRAHTFVRFTPDNSCKIDKLAVEITTAATAGTGHLQIRRSSLVNGKPIGTPFATGTFDPTTTGLKEVTLNTPAQLQAGVTYWISVATFDAPSFSYRALSGCDPGVTGTGLAETVLYAGWQWDHMNVAGNAPGTMTRRDKAPLIQIHVVN